MFWRAIATPVLGFAIGCAPFGSGDGCEPMRATDASAPSVVLRSDRPPCGYGATATRGSEPHLLVSFSCPGESSPFLLGVRVDGALHSLHEVRGAGFGIQVFLDLGRWEPADSNPHAVEVVLDPLNLFKETDESNNRAAATLQIVPPDVAVDPAGCGFTLPPEFGGDGTTLVGEVFDGFAVDVRLRLRYGGPYEAVVREVLNGATVIARDSVSASCPNLSYLTTHQTTRWMPPGPGTYTFTFRVTPRGTTPDSSAGNNSIVRQLWVRPTGSAR